ncbi:MAG: hypothetical protein KGM18_00895 [Sphingomonadales bacterium]|nr:hypothetical protein [Sphingomonadales bacterium]
MGEPLDLAAILPAPAAAGRVVLVCNPQAGRYSPARLAALRGALEQAGHEVAVADSLEYRAGAGGEARELACLVGGDGTARTVVALSRDHAHRADFCLYPAGTVNLIAREAGYGAGAGGLLARMAARAARRHFYGEIDGEPFLCCASVGIDSLVVARVSTRAKRRIGRLAYALALGALLPRWPRPALAVTVDGARHHAEAAFVCKGRFYAGPWVLDPAADLTTPEFRVLLLPRARRRDIARLFASAVLGGRLADPDWVRLSARTIAIAADAPLPVQADGDVVAATPVSIRIAPEPLRFF